MTKGPNKKVPPPSDADNIPDEIIDAADGGLGRITLRELLGMALSHVASAERTNYLRGTADDKGNGTYSRSIAVGSLPLQVLVPRTRTGEFRAKCLPGPYQRAYPDEMRPVILGMLAASRSLNAAGAALRKMGLHVSPDEIGTITQEIVDELDLRNSRPIDTDLICLYFDGKYVEIRDGDRLRPACIYTAIGITLQGKKRVLTCMPRLSKENLEDWKWVLRNLIERGLRRVLIIIQDDFSGLLQTVRALFPKADVQLCMVHLLRNAKSHLGKSDAALFVQRIRALKASWDPDQASKQFDDLCQAFHAAAPTFCAELLKKKPHYLAFLQYPEPVRRTFSTTNAVEAINDQLERMRINSGGYFHSEDSLKLKLGITLDYLETGTWRRVSNSIQAVIHQLNAMFMDRFESDS